MPLLFSLLAFAAVAGCSASDDALGAGESQVIGGSSATGDRDLDAVGMIANGGNRICSGTLITPQLVLTARHCVDIRQNDETGNLNGYYDFLIERYGVEDGLRQPPLTYHVHTALMVGPGRGGYIDYGLDAAILMLEKPVDPASGVKPIPVRRAPLAQGDVGKKLVAVGYGLVDEAYHLPSDTSGLDPRTKGTITLDAIAGQPFHDVFGSADAFTSYVKSKESAAFADRVKGNYDLALNAQGDEIYAGLGTGDATTCSGDSGGALLEKIGDHYELVAMVSGGLHGERHPCLLGGTFTKIGARLAAALETASATATPWQNPVCDQLPQPAYDTRKACDGNTRYDCAYRKDAHDTYLKKEFIESCADEGLTCKSGPGFLGGTDVRCE